MVNPKDRNQLTRSFAFFYVSSLMEGFAGYGLSVLLDFEENLYSPEHLRLNILTKEKTNIIFGIFV